MEYQEKKQNLFSEQQGPPPDEIRYEVCYFSLIIKYDL
jgi:hypothetical protein